MASHPTGTVTFLFTDIEGSTRLWEHHPEAMSHALARHDALMRSAIEAHDGYVFKTMGDAFCAAFATAPQALGAALDAQVRLLAEPWETPVPLRVRMALHTGAAESRDGDYFGPPLNRVARLLSAGHGGQNLLSQSSYELVRDHAPEGVSFHDLGDHRLKDLQRPERISQVLHPLLPAPFPPLRSLDSRPNNLPAQATSLIDRVEELEAARTLLRSPQARLITLTGPGGAGKTRLALQIGADLLDDFEHGVFFVELANITAPDLIAPAIATAVGALESAGQTPLRDLIDHLRDRHLLLALDNFEQVVAGAPVVAELLAACPRLKVLATSRAVLHLRGEREMPVPPLALPDVRRLPPPERLSQYAAVALFIERAVAVKPDFAVTNVNAPALAEICVRLDGLPLAIELAAARSKLLPPQAMLARLDRRLPLLTGGPRDMPARQQTLRNAIAWSWDLLTPEERTLLARLSVFVGGCTLEAAAAVCSDDPSLDNWEAPFLTADPAPELLDGLSALIDHSLLRQTDFTLPGGVSEARFVMLSTIREFTHERLVESGEAGRIQQRHAGYWLALAEAAQPQLGEDRQGEWLDRLEMEHDNLRAALNWAEERGEVERAARMAGAVVVFWRVRGHLREGRARLERLAHLSEDWGPTTVRARVVRGAATIAGDQGDYAVARAHVEETLAIWRALGNRAGEAGSLLNLAVIDLRRGQIESARSHAGQGLAIYRELGNQRGIATALKNLGALALEQGDYAAARRLEEEGLAIKRTLGEKNAIAYSLADLGAIALAQGDSPAARTAFVESLSLQQEVGDKRTIAQLLEHFAALALVESAPERAMVLAGAAAALRESIGAPPSQADQRRLERLTQAARAMFAEADRQAAWAAGAALALDEAINAALTPPLSG